ncbi:breast cancer type 2 susceptibility protein-like [Planococcus citri]|uniref:breast cancer type 2 susceptibility protein-like n=1 Tax=Planococcus citri TaxID=170843 RepID=UPI0031F7AA09
MDTSTPLKKLCSKQLKSLLSSEYKTVNSSTNYKHVNNDVPIEPADSDRLFCDSKYTDANTSIEVFPVSPICCTKNASVNLANLPNLDTSNLKWSTSLHTSHAEEELFVEETMDPIRSQCHCTAEYDDNVTSFKLIESSEGIEDEKFETIRNTSDPPCSPIFPAARGKRRKKDKELVPDEHLDSNGANKGLSDSVCEDIRCLNEHAFDLDDSYGNIFNITARPSESTTLKTSRYSLDFSHENSKKFVYPSASVSIKKPESHLRVDQLTNYALALEVRDSRSSSSSSRKSETKTKTNVLSQNTMMVFNELYFNDCSKDIFDGSLDINLSTIVSPREDQVVVTSTKYGKSKLEILRNIAQIMFACRNNDRETIGRRFEKITDRFCSSDCMAARLMRFLYSSYYFVTFIDLASYRTDEFYQLDALQYFMDRLNDSFKFNVSSVYAEKSFDYFENDVYSLEKLGVPVSGLYVARFKTLRCLSTGCEIDSINMRSESSKVARVLKNERVSNLQDEFSGDLFDFEHFSDVQIANGNRLSIPEKSLKRFVDRFSDVFDDQGDNDVLYPADKKRRIENSSVIVTDTKLPSSFVGITNGFRTGTGKPVSIQTKSLHTSKQIFSDILNPATESNPKHHLENLRGKSNETSTPAACGFKTCSGNPIKVDDKLLQKSKILFSDISSEAGFDLEDDNADSSRKQDKQPASGFKSSSGRTIKVNDHLLRKSENLFSDILTETRSNFGTPRTSNGEYKNPFKTTVPGFKSSSSGTIKVGNESLQKSKNLFSDIFAETECSFGPDEAAVSGFKTGSGRAIKIDDQSLQKSKNLFTDISVETSGEAVPKNGQYKRPIKPEAVGFKTGSGRTIKVDDGSLQSSKNLFSDISIETGCDFGDVVQKNGAYKRPIKPEAVGFKTGSGRTIKVDDGSLQSSKKLFSDISIETACDFGDVVPKNGAYKRPTKPEAAGFKTGSGRMIKVDDGSLQSSKNLFSDISIETACDFGDVVQKNGAYKRPTKPEAAGFKTGSGRTIKVDDGSLQSSKNLFSDISIETACDFGDVVQKNGAYKRPIKPEAAGFKTGSGRTLKIDEESLRTSKNLFSDISVEAESNFDDAAPSTSAYKRPTKTETMGFKTSSERTIKINNESLKTSKNLFSDISAEIEGNSDSNGSSKRSDKAALSGFKTSSGRRIKVNDDFMKLSKNLFSDMMNETEANADAVDANITNNFKTGSGKDVKVSVESLEKPKNSFSDVNSWPEKKVNAVNRTSPKENEMKDVKDKNEHRSPPPRVHNQSFDLSREIMESASAFLYDISHESGSSFFVPNETSIISKTNPLEQSGSSFSVPNETSIISKTTPLEQSESSLCIPKETSTISKTNQHEQSSSSFTIPNDTSTIDKTNSLVEEHRRSDVSNTTASSRSSSPVFDAKYAPTKRKSSSRRTSSVQSLNITFGGRKTNDSSGSSGSDQMSAELETLKMNFSLKSHKRKSSSRDNSQVGTKKCKNGSLSSSPDEDEKLASSRRRATAVAHQQKYISNKPKEFCRPTRGYYSTLIHGSKEAELSAVVDRISLGHLARNEKPKLYSFDEYLKLGLLPAVVRMTSQNARNFTFTSQLITDKLSKTDSNGAILFGDSVPIILNEKNEITLEEIIRGFLASPGVDPKLISRDWITNHYRWIVWKLASMERFFPKSLGRRYLTLDNVLFQLKFKYEQEIDRCVRSALKKILEGDDSAARPLVLCVASIEKGANSSNDYKVELTDGWYSIFAQTDDQINDLISRKKISIGGKIIVIGAELVGFREPCDPLQTSENVRLKFSANSCRRVRWDTRLGFYLGNLSPINRIQTVLPKGGFISHLTAVVARVYPLLFLEKYDNPAADNTAGGPASSTVTWSRLHNEKVEMKKVMAFERDRQNCIESILSQVTNEVLKENGKGNADALTGDCSNQQNNDRLRDIIQQRVQSRLPVKFSKNRHVSRLLKIRLVDAQDVKNKPSAILTIWNPCDDVSNFFKEDRCYNFLNINANQIRNGELQLCSTRSSKYDRSSSNSSGDGNDHWFRRRVRGVEDLNERSEDEDKACSFDEVDVTGVIIKIQSKTRSGDFEQNGRIYLADLQRRFFALSFRIDSKNFDYGDSLESGKIIAGLNLQWKKGWLCWNTPILYVSEFSSFVQSTNIASLQHGIDQIRRHFQTSNLKAFIAECEEKLNTIIDLPADTSANENNRSNTANVSLDTTPTIPATSSPAPASAIDSSHKNKSSNQSTFKNASTRCRFEKLQNYGRPPSLSPLVLTSQSKLKAKLPLKVSRRSFKS